jgi:hypothetical protein
MHSKNIVLYLATGENYISQAVVSLISLVNVYRHSKPNFRVVVLTDNGGPFEWLKQHLDLEVRSVGSDWIEETRGPKKFALRTKLIAIRDILYEDLANVLFVDTDTIHLRKIDLLFDKLDQEFCLLHKKEWPLKKGRLKHPELCPQDLKFDLNSGLRIEINSETEMWNSGVVGIAAKNRHLILDALDLNDRFYDINPSWHVEQFSLSTILQQTGRLRGCRRKIFHYWHSKELAACFIKKAFPYATSKTISKIEFERFVWEARMRFYVHRIRVVMRKNRILYKLFLRIRKAPPQFGGQNSGFV